MSSLPRLHDNDCPLSLSVLPPADRRVSHEGSVLLQALSVAHITCLVTPAHVNARKKISADSPEQNLIILTPVSQTSLVPFLGLDRSGSHRHHFNHGFLRQ